MLRFATHFIKEASKINASEMDDRAMKQDKTDF